MRIDVTDEFLKLVAINSPSGEEGELAKYLVQKLRELGAEAFEDNSASLTGSNTGNIIGLFPGNPEKPTILLAAHMDTVEPTTGMIPQVKDGKIYSDGQNILGADNKAGLAVILSVLQTLKLEESSDPVSVEHGPIEILFTVQEEVGLKGIKNCDYQFQAQYGYVLDGDGPVGTIVNASPSHITLDLTVEGKAAHAGLEPEMGVNAIVVSSEAIAGLPFGRLDQETTSNLGVISGGKARNIVADRVNIKAEVRSRKRERLEEETAKIITKFTNTAQKFGAQFKYEKEMAYEAFTIDPQHPTIIRAIKAGQKMDIDVTWKATGGGLDANILNARGLACVALGLGNEKPHSYEEYADIAELEKARRFIVEILKQTA
ncbi:MAG: M20/M25/M40 family metallo-hydrolase [Desulfitobacteriia bacterium]|jgi:tripeptide aminopeptidase